MSLQSDPIQALRKRMRITQVLGILALIAIGFWAMQPSTATSSSDKVSIDLLPQTEPSKNTSATLPTTAAFAKAKLWNPVPAPAVIQPPTAVAQQPPLRLQLIGIIQEAGELHAALYDIDDDRLLIVKSGQKIKNHTVLAITAKTVQLSDGQSKHELRLLEIGS